MNKREAKRRAHAAAATWLQNLLDREWPPEDDDWYSDDDRERLTEALDDLVQQHYEKGNPR